MKYIRYRNDLGACKSSLELGKQSFGRKKDEEIVEIVEMIETVRQVNPPHPNPR